MAVTHDEVQKSVKALVDKVNEVGPDIAPEWGGAVQFVFPDIKSGWLIKLSMDGSVESWDEVINEDKADGVLEMPGELMYGIMFKGVNPMDPDSLAQMKARKSTDALMKVLPACM